MAAILDESASGRKTLIPGSKDAISALERDKIPYVIVGRDPKMSERQARTDLEELLRFRSSQSCLVLSLSPFRDHVLTYRDKTVVVIGGDGEQPPQKAFKYGFKHVLTTRDIARHLPHNHDKSGAAPSAKLMEPFDAKAEEQRVDEGGDIKVSAIFVWWTSEDWDLDIQLCIDLLLTKQGRLGTHGIDNLAQFALDLEQQPQLFICKAETASDHGFTVPRREGRTWLRTLQRRWKAETGLPLMDVTNGFYEGAGRDQATLHYADAMLRDRNRQMNTDRHPFPRCVYTIGREIESDAMSDAVPVRFGAPYRRRSVRVGPPRPGASRPLSVHDFEPVTRPWHVAATLKEAVEYALAEEYWECLEQDITPLFPNPEWAETSLR